MLGCAGWGVAMGGGGARANSNRPLIFGSPFQISLFPRGHFLWFWVWGVVWVSGPPDQPPCPPPPPVLWISTSLASSVDTWTVAVGGGAKGVRGRGQADRDLYRGGVCVGGGGSLLFHCLHQSVALPRESSCPFFVTERYLWSSRPLTSLSFLSFVLSAACAHVT